MNNQLLPITYVFLAIFFVLAIGFGYWQHRQNNQQHKNNKANQGDDFGGWNKVDQDFNGN